MQADPTADASEISGPGDLDTKSDRDSWSHCGKVATLAVGLTVVFWYPLWLGGGLVGSDIYAYFLPQKQIYAEALAEGELPLWNNRVGFGYPQLAESQTGVLYPFHLVLYRTLDLNTAYNANVIIHYALAFWFTWLFARRLKLSPIAAGLAALVFVYGWFPARICLEWSILGGTWLPAALLCVENFRRTRFWRHLFLLTLALALQMLAGHFLIAFLTQLTLAAYVPLRMWNTVARSRMIAAVAVAIFAAFPLTAVQLVPTWELKQLSQRAVEGPDLHLGQGHIPVWYWSQIVAPWFWYFDDVDLNRPLPPDSPTTNQVEAHLYFGLLPFALIVWGICSHSRRAAFRRPIRIWVAIGLAALAYTPGWFIPLTRHLPGFSFFEGPGRYGVITTLALALVAGSCWDAVSRRWRLNWLHGIASLIFLLTIADLWVVSRLVTTAFLTWEPPIDSIKDSPIRDYLSAWPVPQRLLCRGFGVPTLLGVAATPTYLGLGPAAYFDPKLKMPEPHPFSVPDVTGPVTPEQIEWLHRVGVTHVLSFTPVDGSWRALLLWLGEDSFLNAVWGRYQKSLFLYGFPQSRGRVACETADESCRVAITSYSLHEVVVEASVAENPSGSTRVVLTDLAYPGWTVSVDGQPAESRVVDGMFRGVDVPPGEHTIVWRYRPASVWWGACISLVTAGLLAVIGHLRFWHPKLFSKFV